MNSLQHSKDKVKHEITPYDPFKCYVIFDTFRSSHVTSENFEYTTYTTVQKFRVSKTLMFLKYLCLKQHVFKQKYS